MPAREDILQSIRVYSAVGFGVDNTVDGVAPRGQTNDLKPFVIEIQETFILDEVDVLTMDVAKGSVWHMENTLQARQRIVIHRSVRIGQKTEDIYRLYRIRSVRTGTGEDSRCHVEAWGIDHDLTKALFRRIPSPLLAGERGTSVRIQDYRDILVPEILRDVMVNSCSLDDAFRLGTIATRFNTLRISPYFENSSVWECLAIMDEEMKKIGSRLEWEVRYDHPQGRIVIDFVESRGATAAEQRSGDFAQDINQRQITIQFPNANRIGATVQDIQDDYVSRLIPWIDDDGSEIGISSVIWSVEDDSYDSTAGRTTLTLEPECIGFDDQFNYPGTRTSDWGVRDGGQDLTGEIDHVASINLGAPQSSSTMLWADEAQTIQQKGWRVPKEIVIGASDAFIRRFELNGSGGTISLQVSTGSSAGSATGPELTDGWEKGIDALVIRVRDQFFTIPGPANTDGSQVDSTEPYQWSLKGSYEMRRQEFVTAWQALSTAEQASTMLQIQWTETVGNLTGTSPHRVVATDKEKRQIIVEGEFTASSVVFVERCGNLWQKLDYVRRPDGEAVLDVVTRAEEVRNASPYENLVARAGATADMSEFNNGLPKGWESFAPEDTTFSGQLTNPKPVVEQSTMFARSGKNTARVRCEGFGMGIRVPLDLIEFRTDGRYVSAFVTIQVVRGQVALELSGGEEQQYLFPARKDPRVEASSTGVTVALKLEGATPPAGDGYLILRALQNATEFFLDSVSVTPSPTAWEYSPRMGPKDLWRAATEFMADKGGVRPLTTQVKIVDLSRIASNILPIRVGAWVRLVDLMENGTPGMTLEGRVERVVDSENNLTGSFVQSAVIGRQRRNAFLELGKDFPDRKPVGELPSIAPELPDDAEVTIPQQWSIAGMELVCSVVDGDATLRWRNEGPGVVSLMTYEGKEYALTSGRHVFGDEADVVGYVGFLYFDPTLPTELSHTTSFAAATSNERVVVAFGRRNDAMSDCPEYLFFEEDIGNTKINLLFKNQPTYYSPAGTLVGDFGMVTSGANRFTPPTTFGDKTTAEKDLAVLGDIDLKGDLHIEGEIITGRAFDISDIVYARSRQGTTNSTMSLSFRVGRDVVNTLIVETPGGGALPALSAGTIERVLDLTPAIGYLLSGGGQTFRVTLGSRNLSSQPLQGVHILTFDYDLHAEYSPPRRNGFDQYTSADAADVLARVKAQGTALYDDQQRRVEYTAGLGISITGQTIAVTRPLPSGGSDDQVLRIDGNSLGWEDLPAATEPLITKIAASDLSAFVDEYKFSQVSYDSSTKTLTIRNVPLGLSEIINADKNPNVPAQVVTAIEQSKPSGTGLKITKSDLPFRSIAFAGKVSGPITDVSLSNGVLTFTR